MEPRYEDLVGGVGASDYTLPTASDTIKGGVKVGDRLTVINDVLSADGQVLDNFIDSATLAPSTRTVVNALNLKADLISPIFTGSPQAPTPIINDVGNKIATTSFVDSYFNSKQTTFAIIRPDHSVKYLNTWPSSTDSPVGSQIRMRGTFGDAGALYVFPSYCSLHLEENSVFTVGRLVPQNPGTYNQGDRVIISGSGKIKGNIVIYAGLLVHTTIRDIIHNGQLIAEGGNATINDYDLTLENITATPPLGFAYYVSYLRNFSASQPVGFINLLIKNCIIKVSGISPASGGGSIYPNNIRNVTASALQINSFNYPGPNPQDAIDKSNYKIDVIGCIFIGDGTNPIISMYGGFATTRYAQNTVKDIATPYPTSDAGLSAFGVDVTVNSSTSKTLEFVFNAGFADDFTTTVGNNQAGIFTTNSLSNVTSVVYKVNTVTKTLPITLVAGDNLQVTITRTSTSTGSIVTLTT